jgi:hypothetical protein
MVGFVFVSELRRCPAMAPVSVASRYGAPQMQVTKRPTNAITRIPNTYGHHDVAAVIGFADGTARSGIPGIANGLDEWQSVYKRRKVFDDRLVLAQDDVHIDDSRQSLQRAGDVAHTGAARHSADA